MKAYFLQRLVAYFIDFIIITLVLNVLVFFIPISKNYTEAYKNAEKISEDFVSGEISSTEYLEEYSKESYVIEKETAIVTVLNILIITAYFGTYAYYKNGQTIGKKVMKIKIVDNDEKPVKHKPLIIRTILIYGIAIDVICLIVLQFITANQYLYTINNINIVQSLFVIVSLFMIMFRKDGRGLHDIICNTRVISMK